MGILRQGILGDAIGKIGNVVGSKWRDKNVVKIYNGSPKDRNSQEQQAQRAVMTGVTAFCRKMLSGIRQGFVNFNTKIPQYSNAMSVNMLTWVEEAATALLEIRTLLVISRGNLTVSGVIATVELAATYWDFSVTALKPNEYDKFYAMIFNFDTGESSVFIQDVAVDATVIAIDMPLPFGTIAGHQLQIYAFGYQSTTGNSMDSINFAGVAV